MVESADTEPHYGKQTICLHKGIWASGHLERRTSEVLVSMVGPRINPQSCPRVTYVLLRNSSIEIKA